MVYNMHRHTKHNGYPRFHVQLYVEGESDDSHRRHGRRCEQEFDDVGSEVRMGQVSGERRAREFLLGLHPDGAAR